MALRTMPWWTGLLFCVAVVGAGVLTYFALRPVYTVEVLVQPSSEVQARVLSKKIWTKPNDNGIVFFDFQAQLKDPAIEKVFLETRPETEPKFYPQGEDGYRVDNGIVTGVVKLGSPQRPVKQDQNYTFQLLFPPDKTRLLDGEIQVHVEKILRADWWAVTGFGALASILQILSFLFPRSLKKAQKKLKVDESSKPLSPSM